MNRTISMSVSNSNLMHVYFSIDVPYETRQNVVMRESKLYSRLQLSQKFSKMSTNNKTSIFKYITVLSERSNRKALPDVHDMSEIVLEYGVSL